MKELLELFKEALGLGADITAYTIKAYWDFLKKVSLYSGILVGILILFLILGFALEIRLIISFCLALSGVILAGWLLLAFPITVLVQYGYEKIDAVKRTVQLIGLIVLWFFFLALYFYFVPIPKIGIPLVFLLCIAMASASVVFGVGISTKFIALRLGIIFVIMTISFFFPKSLLSTTGFISWTDERISKLMEKITNPPPKSPGRVYYSEDLTFFDPITKEPRIWYYKTNGEYELFNAPGFHPKYGTELKLITVNVVKEIERKIKEGEKRKERLQKLEEERKKSELEKKIESEKIKEVENIEEHKIEEVKAENSNNSFDTPNPKLIIPVLLKKTTISYTREALEVRIQGEVVLQMVVQEDGTVDQFKVIQGLGYGLEEAAIEEMKKNWRFKPGTLNGRPVKVSTTVSIQFKLR